MIRMLIIRVVLMLAVPQVVVLPSFAGTVTFGSGVNQFAMDFVTIGNPGNPGNGGYGAVGYSFDIGKYEVSREMITKFNASQSVQITLADLSDVGGNGSQKPATGMTTVQAAKFVNWLNTSSGYQAAYQFTSGGTEQALKWIGDSGYDPSNPYRNKFAKFFLPSQNEWYKAAYYDPNKGTSGGYWFYPTGSDTLPAAVTGGTLGNTAVYGQALTQGPANVSNAGGLSAYGVMGLAGNVWEWQQFTDQWGSGVKPYAGGNWLQDASYFNNNLLWLTLQDTGRSIGFRVASLTSTSAPVPEPSMLVVATLIGIGGYINRKRIRK